MNRAAAVAFVQGRFNTMLGAARILLTDTVDGIAPIIDDAWAKVGVAVGTDIPVTMQRRAELALKIAVFERVLNNFVTRYDKTIGGITLAQFDMAEGVLRLLKDARAEANALGLETGEAAYQEIFLRPSSVRFTDEFGFTDLPPGP